MPPTPAAAPTRSVRLLAVAAEPDEGDDPVGIEQEPTTETRQLLRLLATGATDRTIARVLGVSERTVHRRVSRLQVLLGARSRFQLGYLACAKQWV